MQDEPAPPEILAAVAAFLRDTVAPATTGMTAFQARVAANAVDLVARQLMLAAASDAAEHDLLCAVLGREGSLAELNAALAASIGDGRIDFAAPDVAQHLRATTLAKLAVDQPNYASYRAALAEKDA